MRPIRALLRRAPAAAALAATAALLPAAPAVAAPGDAIATTAEPRVVAYYQTIYESDADGRRYVDPTPLVGAVTDLELGAIHLNDDGSLHVNDITADHPDLAPMWADLAAIQDAGVAVHAFVGGAAPGTYRNLADDFDRFYPLLRDFLVARDLDGVDLDIEEPFLLADTIHLVETLRADFGPGFTITLTPVAADLAGRTSFSGGFSYAELEAAVGHQIDWYNTQFYCGWGDLRTTAAFEAILANGFTADRVVAGTVTNPDNCSGWVEPDVLDATLTELRTAHPTLGGVFGWEYFNALGRDGGGRETWFSHLRDLLRAPAEVERGALSVAYATVPAGGTQTVHGTGFVPGEAVTVAVTGPAATDTASAAAPEGARVSAAVAAGAGTPPAPAAAVTAPVATTAAVVAGRVPADAEVGTVTADDEGAFGLTYDVPPDAAPGAYTVSATGTGGAAEAGYTVAAVPSPEPAPGDGPGLPAPGADPGASGAPPAAGPGAAGTAGPLARTGVPAAAWLGAAATLTAAGTALALRARRTSP
ncbi:glycosyl hydrolase family 18 protein [Cellulosimicrobium cellulans]|uniref:glycosyl hydrolase family 18 protein n=1 Tax=Cellulosimicrobium cellulans TaxID=1710 RepID=UPI00130DB4B1|nr:glycosyl hydrolase family 18 protein [Cellulosimicrobium cellulans]